jgi:thiamine-monophosphate kinase
LVQRPPGEFELIAAIRARIAAAGAPEAAPASALGSGDDAAIAGPRSATATSVDAVVEGIHFRRPPFTLANVGHKALAAALSDLAAMGAEPAEAFVQLGIPAGLTAEECLEIADGLGGAAAAHAVAVAGGDLTRSPVLFLAVTAVGTARSVDDLVRRSGARPGDVVAVTGELGGAAAGLRLLERPELAAGLEPETAAALRRRQLEPAPPLAAGRALAAGGATAMIDVSDGLGADANHVAGASGVVVRIELASIPVQAGVAEVARASGADPLDLAAAGGEDYELLVTLAPTAVEGATQAVAGAGTRLTVIGEVRSTGGQPPGAALNEPRGGARPPAGFDQLRFRAPGARG